MDYFYLDLLQNDNLETQNHSTESTTKSCVSKPVPDLHRLTKNTNLHMP